MSKKYDGVENLWGSQKILGVGRGWGTKFNCRWWDNPHFVEISVRREIEGCSDDFQLSIEEGHNRGISISMENVRAWKVRGVPTEKSWKVRDVPNACQPKNLLKITLRT